MPSHYQGTESELRALNAYINLTRAVNTLDSALANELQAQGLTVSQFGTLEALYHLGPLCQHEIGDKLLKSGGNITMVIDNLEKRGWVKPARGKRSAHAAHRVDARRPPPHRASAAPSCRRDHHRDVCAERFGARGVARALPQTRTRRTRTKTLNYSGRVVNPRPYD